MELPLLGELHGANFSKRSDIYQFSANWAIFFDFSRDSVSAAKHRELLNRSTGAGLDIIQVD
ncbi:hypothetical protein [Limnohabitans sp. Rim8]|uniref:hypothetical protein n=1 Tax=Limnohabitans sp. Rim8 TaxID=1100718 RepID=UPI003306042A